MMEQTLKLGVPEGYTIQGYRIAKKGDFYLNRGEVTEWMSEYTSGHDKVILTKDIPKEVEVNLTLNTGEAALLLSILNSPACLQSEMLHSSANMKLESNDIAHVTATFGDSLFYKARKSLCGSEPFNPHLKALVKDSYKIIT